MGRGHYSPAMLEEAVRELSAHWPAMGLGADIIAGFPGETEKDVQELLELVARLPLGYAHVFPYSRRPGTAAERFEGQIPHALKLERAARVRQAVALKQKEFLMAQMALPRMLLAADISGSIQKAPQAASTNIMRPASCVHGRRPPQKAGFPLPRSPGFCPCGQWSCQTRD